MRAGARLILFSVAVFILPPSPALRCAAASTAAIAFEDTGVNLNMTGPSFFTALGDVDGDGDLDAFVVQYDVSSRLWINVGGGQYARSSQSFGTTTAHGAVFGDFNGDGDLDLYLVFNENQDRVYRNNGAGTFTDTGQRLGSATDAGLAATSGDIDGDGDIDVAVMNYLHPIAIWRNNGSGTFGSRVDYGDNDRLAFGDFDGDGDLDMFTVGVLAMDDKVWLNDGAGNFTDSGQRLGPTDGFGRVDVADLDGDGDLDAFVSNNVTGSTVYLNDGTGRFPEAGLPMGGTSHFIALGDLDRDGDIDAITTHTVNGNTIWMNDGSGAFTLSGYLEPVLMSGFSICLGDTDGDGDLDAFAAYDAEALGNPVKYYRNVTAVVANRSTSWGSLKNLPGK